MNTSKLHKAGKIDVVELHGNYRQMGREYGKLLKERLKAFYGQSVDDHFIKKGGLKLTSIREFSEGVFVLYPQRFKEFLLGISETSAMSIKKLILLDQVLAITFAVRRDKLGCSGIAAWGEYTSGGPLIFGRNFDLSEDFKPFSEFMIATVFNPDDGSIPVCSIGYVGQLGVCTGMNKAGLFLENNEAIASGGNVFYINRVLALVMELAFLLDCSNIEGLTAAFNTTRTNCPLIVNVADKDRAYSYEWTTFDLKRRAAEREGLLASTNHFMDTAWGLLIPDADTSEFTIKRRENLLTLGEKYKGRFNVKNMKALLNLTFEDGGVTKNDNTVLQTIAVPQKLELHLKIPGFQDWIMIDLKKLFR